MTRSKSDSIFTGDFDSFQDLGGPGPLGLVWCDPDPLDPACFVQQDSGRTGDPKRVQPNAVKKAVALRDLASLVEQDRKAITLFPDEFAGPGHAVDLLSRDGNDANIPVVELVPV